VIQGKRLGAAVSEVDFADIKAVGHGKFLIVVPDRKSKIAHETDRGVGFVIMKLFVVDDARVGRVLAIPVPGGMKSTLSGSRKDATKSRL
jgi:hypothetical protein